MTLSLGEINEAQYSAAQVGFLEAFTRGTQKIEGTRTRLWKGSVELNLFCCDTGIYLADITSLKKYEGHGTKACLLYTSPSPRDS